jgi:hypothetical protein
VTAVLSGLSFVVITIVAHPALERSAASPACPASAPVAGPGVVDPFHVPPPAAAQLNADGKALYRQGRWDEARQKYRAATALDPDFLAPVLNIACSFVRQERFADALSEVVGLVDRSYLPWSEEVLSAADLGALKIRAEGKPLRAGLEAARLRWAQGLAADLVMIARVRAPLKLDSVGSDRVGEVAPRALVLGLRQEVFAWSPRTRRYRQLTAEEGRVLALGRSRDGRRISYVTAEKLIRGPSDVTALRGLAVSELDLTTLTPLGRGSIAGDVQRIDILAIGAGFAYRVEGASGATTFGLVDGKLQPRAGLASLQPVATLTGRGLSGVARSTPLGGGCAGTAREVRSKDGTPPFVRIVVDGRTPANFPIGGPFGAGLAGLPIP